MKKFNMFPHIDKELLDFDYSDILRMSKNMDAEVTHSKIKTDGTKVGYR